MERLVLAVFLCVFVAAPLLMIAAGLVSIVSPRVTWFLTEGWKFRNAEPSPLGLLMIRLKGLMSIVVGVAFSLFLWFVVHNASRNGIVTVHPEEPPVIRPLSK